MHLSEQEDDSAHVAISAQAKSRYAAPALEKGLDILELFAHEKGGLLQSEVGRKLNRTTSEVFRMLAVLERRGYIAQGADERYRLTLRLFELAQQHPPTRRLVAEALPHMQEIADSTGQSCHLGVIDESEVVIVAQVDAPVTMGFAVKAGSRMDVFAAATGYVILAFGNSIPCERVLERVRARGKQIPADLPAHLEKIRTAGFEERRSYQVQGVLDLSYPVLDHNGEAVAAITIPFLPRQDHHTAREETLAALARGAEQVSSAMGFHASRIRERPSI